MRRQNRGFTLIEVLGALAIGSALVAGIAALVEASLEESRGEQAALYQAQMTAAAARYINLDANYTQLLTATGGAASTVVTAAMLRAGNHLPQNVQAANAYGQTSCVLVRQSKPGQLDALVVSEGGRDIPAKSIAAVAAGAGPGAGYIPADAPTSARGAFNSWSQPLAAFGGGKCSGTAVAANHLASALFFNGAGQLAADFVYRKAQPGRPELNQMHTPLHMRAQAVEGSSDALCVAGDAATFGRIAVDASGALLNCKLGVWRGAGGSWKDPAASFAALPASENQAGDVRLALDTGRAFSWSGAAWIALAVDEQGNLAVPGRVTAGQMLLERVVVHRDACEPDGLLARDASGLLLSCQRGKWRKLIEFEATNVVFDRVFNTRPLDSGIDTSIDLSALPGARPLFITGDSCCVSRSNSRSVIRLELYDAAGKFLGYAGGCASQSAEGEGRVASAAGIALQQLPENAARLRVVLDISGEKRNNADTYIIILNSR
ncbi:shufflon system plasmid conjugative transfer pilus tip adhesin PilV [Massilia sp. erpn]|uniref:shufflon system plasmid conjugative transfer pilus tip adhesin PilV n=1 Tax=Massilia sp. erpn TaxID=2738142 RepID=UPI0021022AC8|nr:shufflon system plasmid conjugative transfer pilus tip adhesin PilV [Massilia sp. erpn]UTY59682.1 shufflon system plasmid conjugative transfer pilus tip adhesin PilV [Massilia sp. erpn]